MTTFLSPETVAKMLGVTRQTLWLWRCSRKNLAFVRIGRKTQYDKRDVLAFLDKNRQPVGDESV